MTTPKYIFIINNFASDLSGCLFFINFVYGNVNCIQDLRLVWEITNNMPFIAENYLTKILTPIKYTFSVYYCKQIYQIYWCYQYKILTC